MPVREQVHYKVNLLLDFSLLTSSILVSFYILV